MEDFISSEEEKNILWNIENDRSANWESELTRRVKVSNQDDVRGDEMKGDDVIQYNMM